MGNVVLLVVVGLLEASLNGDDLIRAGHLQLQVGVVVDDHELGEAWPTKEIMVDHLNGEQLLLEVVQPAEGDVEPYAHEGHDLLPGYDP